jgi:hypothetical protein
MFPGVPFSVDNYCLIGGITSTFGENQTNRRLILSNVSWGSIFRRKLLLRSAVSPDLMKNQPVDP